MGCERSVADRACNRLWGCPDVAGKRVSQSGLRRHGHDKERRGRSTASSELLGAGGAGSRLVASGAVLVHHALTRVGADGPHLLGPGAHGLPVDGAGDAVVELDVELGQLVVVDDAGLVEIAQRGLVDDVAHGEALDGLVLGGLAAAAVAHDQTGVVATVAVATVVATLHSHFGFTAGGGGRLIAGMRRAVAYGAAECCVQEYERVAADAADVGGLDDGSSSRRCCPGVRIERGG